MRLEYRFVRGSVCGALAVMSLAACSKDKKSPSTASNADTAVAVTPMTPRDSLGRPIGRVIRPLLFNGASTRNGAVEIVAMELLQPTQGFPGPFTTYKMQDMQMASAKIGSVGTITLSPLVNGAANPNAFIQIQFDTTNLSVDDPAGAAFKEATKGMKTSTPVVDDVTTYPWADGAKSFRYAVEGKPITGVMIVGHRGPDAFHILAQTPPEYAGEMTRRLNLIIKHWRWDDYMYLVPSGPMAMDSVPVDSAAKAVPLPTTRRKK